MAIVKITAIFLCDGCDTRFETDLDPGTTVTAGQQLLEEAEEFLGCGPNEGLSLYNMHLCRECACIANDVRPGNIEFAPRDEIVNALRYLPNGRLRG